VSLIRNSGLSRLPEKLLLDTFGVFESMSQEQGLSMPTMEWEIEGPVLQVLPVAIFA
jgi:hypothetical protein